MGERIFFSKLRKVLASWLLCIKFENARLVIFQIGYGPSHLISVLAVSAWLSPLPKFLLAGAQRYGSGRVRECAPGVGWGAGKGRSPPTPPLPSSCSPRFPAQELEIPMIWDMANQAVPKKKPNAPNEVFLSETRAELFPGCWD